ncbi:MAG: outer membrane lipoprotein carrier protein LolA [Acidobacteriota bacterium]
MRRTLGILFLLSVVGISSADAAALPDPRTALPAQRLSALIDRIKIEQAKVKTLEAKFIQHQESSMLAEPETSTGSFSYAAPDKVRWEYATPNPISVVILGETMTTWYHDLNRAETLKVGRYSAQVFKYLGASGSMKSLLEYFTATLHTSTKKGTPFRLDLTPRYARIAKRLKSMSLWIDDEKFFPVHLEYVDAEGDKTQYDLKDLKVNAPIPADRFALKLPPGVQTKVIDLDRNGKKVPEKPH